MKPTTAFGVQKINKLQIDINLYFCYNERDYNIVGQTTFIVSCKY